MAAVPTSEQNARLILEMFVKRFDRKPGQVLRQKNFNGVMHEFGINSSDFSLGLQFAIKRGWIESLEINVYTMTEDGFAQV